MGEKEAVKKVATRAALLESVMVELMG